jgi:hypothetical protein
LLVVAVVGQERSVIQIAQDLVAMVLHLQFLALLLLTLVEAVEEETAPV